jgi:4-hydroxy-3-methylbut-2-en-1-yl diphosphate reductase
VDPAMPADEAMPIVTALRARFPELRGHNFGVLCEVASDWTQTVAAVAAGCELMLVLTAAAGGGELEAVRASSRGVPVRAVTALADLDRRVLEQATVIGLVTGLSAPAGLQSQVISALSGLGPLSIRHRSTRTVPDTREPDTRVPDTRDPDNRDWSQDGGAGQDLFRSAVGGVREEP